jgi:hypothetical protein
MLLEAVVVIAGIGLLAILLIRLRGGAFPPGFGKFDLRYPWLFVLAFLIQFLLAVLGIKQVAIIGKIFPWVYIVSYLILLFAVAKNWPLFGMRIALLGIGLNFLVIVANAGHMPASAERAKQIGKADLLVNQYYPRSRPITPHTRLAFLGDVFSLNKPYPFPQIFSLGDIFVTLGVAWLVLAGLGLLPENFAGHRFAEKG